MSPRKRRLGEKFTSLYLWHRYAGLVAALLAIWLAVTGIVLNHTDDLRLANNFVQQQWLLDAYHLHAPREIFGERIAGHWLAESSDRVYLDGRFVAHGDVVGSAPTGFGFVVALRDRLQLYTADAVLVEEIVFTATSAELTGISPQPDGVLLVAGQEQFLADSDFLLFERVEPRTLKAKQPLQALPEPLAQVIAQDVLHHALSWERVMLDLHAGRLFGTMGKWIADIAGVLLLLLAISGVIVWVQRARARRRHR